MDDRGALGEDAVEDRIDLGQRIRPHDEHGVGRPGDAPAGLTEHMAQLPRVGGVFGRQVDLGPVRAPHLGAPHLRQSPKLLRGLGEVDTVAGDDDRVLGTGEEFRRPVEGRRVGRAPRDGVRRRHGRLGGVPVHHVGGQHHQDGAVGGVPATLNARRRIRSVDSGSTTRVAHLVTGSAMPTRSAAICASMAS